jgi:hypothetical protein
LLNLLTVDDVQVESLKWEIFASSPAVVGLDILVAVYIN